MMPACTSVSKLCSLFQESRSWTDDLRKCIDTGIGTAVNSVYQEDGQRKEEHPFEDENIHLRYSDSVILYGVFDGHDGVQLAKAAKDQISAEILLGDLNVNARDEEVRRILKQAFVTAEKNYLEEIGGKLAERTSLNDEIPHDLTPYEAYKKHPAIINKLNSINTDLSCGTTAVVTLIYEGRLFVANVGDARALLCRTDSDGVLRVLQLSQDHVPSNEDEILRLTTLGIAKEKIHPGFHLGNQEHTRCLGHFLVKGGYKEFEELACATSEPVIAVPDIAGGIPIDSSFKFLMLMSSGLYKSLEEATGTHKVNKEITQLVVEQFRTQRTLNSVAQAVVDKVVRIYHDYFMSRTGSDRTAITKREDITLLIRNFNYPLPNAISPSSHNAGITFVDRMIPEQDNNVQSGSITPSSEPTTVNSSVSYSRPNPLDSSFRFKPYVDFTDFYEKVEAAKREGTLEDDFDFDLDT